MNFYDFNGMRGYGNQSAENGNGKQNSCNFARDRIATPRVKINLLRTSLPNTRKRAKRS